MDALAFLAKPNVGPLHVVFGDEAFLKRLVVRAVRTQALGDDADDQAVSTYQGDKAAFAEVFDELDSVPFFHPRRVLLIENADPFVTKYRAELEKKLSHLPAAGVLILDVKTWAANTRLAKMISGAAAIDCKAPKKNTLAKWCADWCAKQYQKQLTADAAQLLTELVEPEMGVLDQELLKLSIAIGARQRIDYADVERFVASSHAQDIWLIFDRMGAGDVKGTLAIVDRLFAQGEEPHRILGAMTFQLRKLAQAARLTGEGMSLGAALPAAGIPPFKLREAETQLRHLGRRRLGLLYDWLLQMNMDLRGNSPLPPRTLFERFMLKLARKNEATKAVAS
jgi:DNA polymerase-3 subunit delta